MLLSTIGTLAVIVVGIGAVIMGLWRGFSAIHKVISALEANTKGLVDNTEKLEAVATTLESHAERIVRLETMVQITSPRPTLGHKQQH